MSESMWCGVRCARTSKIQLDKPTLVASHCACAFPKMMNWNLMSIYDGNLHKIFGKTMMRHAHKTSSVDVTFFSCLICYLCRCVIDLCLCLCASAYVSARSSVWAVCGCIRSVIIFGGSIAMSPRCVALYSSDNFQSICCSCSSTSRTMRHWWIE